MNGRFFIILLIISVIGRSVSYESLTVSDDSEVSILDKCIFQPILRDSEVILQSLLYTAVGIIFYENPQIFDSVLKKARLFLNSWPQSIYEYYKSQVLGQEQEQETVAHQNRIRESVRIGRKEERRTLKQKEEIAAREKRLRNKIRKPVKKVRKEEKSASKQKQETLAREKSLRDKMVSKPKIKEKKERKEEKSALKQKHETLAREKSLRDKMVSKPKSKPKIKEKKVAKTVKGSKKLSRREEPKIAIDQKQATFAREEQRRFEMERQYRENLFEEVFDNEKSADNKIESEEFLEDDPIIIEI
jgi:hypothetical protein